MKRVDAKEMLQQYQELIARIIDKPCTLTFDKHSFSNVIVKGIQLGKVTGMKNAPVKRMDDEGKMKSPMIFEIQTDQGNLVFPFDDTTVSALTNGIRLTVNLIEPLKDVDKIRVELRMQ